MKALPLVASALLLSGLALQAPTLGATLASPQYGGCPPGPPPPPPPGGGSGGGSGGSPTSPRPSLPNLPTVGPGPAPSSPAPSTPGLPATAPPGLGPASGGGTAAANPGSSGGVISETSIGSFSDDSLHWSNWWYLESARFLDLRKNIQGPASEDGRTVLLTAPRAPSRNVVQATVVPALLKVATEERSDPMVAAALVSLGRLADAPADLHQRAVDVTRDRLRHSNGHVRESAILALGLFGTGECTDDLVAILSGSARGRALIGSESVTTRTRAFAAHALGLAAKRIDDTRERQRIALELITALDDQVSRQSDLPVAALSSLGLVDLPDRLSIPASELRERDHVDHVLSTRHLTRFLLPITSKAVGRSSERTPTVRAHACVALARAARGATDETRARAIDHLVALGKDRSEPSILRTSASIALGEIARAGVSEPDREARRYLLDVAKRGQPLERRFALIAAASACSRPGAGESPLEGADEVRRALTAELGRARSGELGWASLALGVLEDALHDVGVATPSTGYDVLASLSIRKRNDDDSAALGLGMALATRGTERSKKAGERLVAELRDTSTPELRGSLLVALGITEYRAAAELVRKDLQRASNQPLLLWSSAVSLGLMGEPVDGDLVRMLGGSRSANERIGIAAALGQVGTANAVQPLLDLLAESQRPAPMRAAAIESLGAICDLDRMPWRDPIAHALPYFAGTATLSSNGLGLLERPW